MELYLGTGGYSNDDWLGLLYPLGTKPTDYLKVYTEHFNAVELNSSFYAIPGLKAFEGMVKKSESKVRFSIKIPQEMTHKRDADDELYKRLFESVQPLRDVGMLGPFLAQFPYSFHRTPENRIYLKTLVDKFTHEKLAVEFRHGSWDNPDVRDGCKQLGIIFVSVDYPNMQGLPKSGLHITSDIAYIRMHGRNREKWWEGKDQSERHDYEYTPDELKPWVLQIKELESDLNQVYLMMQNTTKGHALKNLKMLKGLFNDVGLEAPINL
jgi:uncharacterized protein YecE (DUF72 family)